MPYTNLLRSRPIGIYRFKNECHNSIIKLISIRPISFVIAILISAWPHIARIYCSIQLTISSRAILFVKNKRILSIGLLIITHVSRPSIRILKMVYLSISTRSRPIKLICIIGTLHRGLSTTKRQIRILAIIGIIFGNLTAPILVIRTRNAPPRSCFANLKIVHTGSRTIIISITTKTIRIGTERLRPHHRSFISQLHIYHSLDSEIKSHTNRERAKNAPGTYSQYIKLYPLCQQGIDRYRC